MIYQLIYSSQSTVPMSSEDLEDLLENARINNGAAGVSGALVYTDRIFLQILEGERETVEALMARIAKDVRHENVTILREGVIPVARFSSWNMAYIGATQEQAAQWAGLETDGDADDGSRDNAELDRIAQFTHDIVALLRPSGPDDRRA